jgi:tol-pal system protein YbgF
MNRSLVGFILIGGLTIAPVSLVFAAAPVEDLTQQDAGPASYNDSSNLTTPVTQGAGETRAFRPSSAPPTPTTPSRSSMSTEQRINLLEQQVRNLTQLDPAVQINRLQTDVDRLRGQVEVQDHTIKQLTEQLRTQYQDIDQRLTQSGGQAASKKPGQPSSQTATPVTTRPKPKPVNTSSFDETADVPAATTTTTTTTKTSKKTGTQPAVDDGIVDPDAVDINNADSATKTKDNLSPAATSAATSGGPKDALSEKKDYDAAIALLKKQDYVRATTQLQRYLRDYPNGKYTASSHYWLGKIYSYQGQPDLAISEYNTVITKFPKDPKMPNALLDLGIAYDEAGDWEQAKAQLNKVIKLFPKTETAQLAAARLQKIKRQGL